MSIRGRVLISPRLTPDSDTTSATLTYTTYEIIKHPRVIEKLHQEMAPLVHADGSVDHQALQDCKYLNAVIDETLRLHPPVPSGLIRVTPPDGLQVGETYIPGDTNVVMPLYSIQRSKHPPHPI